jgi:glutamine synthetase
LRDVADRLLETTKVEYVDEGVLDQAINVMQDSELVAETLGEHVFDFFLRNKREEWQEYRRQVTEYELSRYLPML